MSLYNEVDLPIESIKQYIENSYKPIIKIRQKLDQLIQKQEKIDLSDDEYDKESFYI
jgi:hypothetical protein